ncbi:MAG: carboxylating nicotinate-nucleotide diphosphorylase [Proteobacteria bacterium]|nr:carboxylating nicotinate-nucleotide diphosphorylase [Pseudomonadota bacterium]NDC24715.1 carboxylating nicotinate-nucleotide diphosphorylase [Pseudomonadota bacterium]NDD04574.1 carboxylating nicotinate-nucleotide diphosphorylase [Pseudomonadota bacterium]NDG27013.1 carboxylating nicotinate-nucleotide diphosphorylase [Pseudomonadota bacterium]
MSLFTLKTLILDELETDRFQDDVTAQLLETKQYTNGKSIVSTREDGIFSGAAIVQAFHEIFQGTLSLDLKVQESSQIHKGQSLLILKGPLGTLLSVERTLLNFLGHSCGIASLTRKFVDAVQPHPTRILATRKTLPGLRDLQLNAVVAGGGSIHRRSLSDGILIKDNHTALEKAEVLLKRAQSCHSPLHGTELEVQNFSLLQSVLKLEQRPQIIMLDNFSQTELKEAVRLIRQSDPSCKIEASGGVNLNTVSEIAAAGVDFISVGRLTHSAASLNLTLDFEL